MEVEIFVSGKKKLPIQEFPDARGRSLSVISYNLFIHFLILFFRLQRRIKRLKTTAAMGRQKLEVSK